MADDGRVRDDAAAALDELRELAARYRSLLAALPDAVTVTDLQGRITEASAQADALWGGTGTKGLVGRNAFDQIAPEDRARAAAGMHRTLTEGVARGLEYSLLRIDGTRYTGELSAALVRGASGEPVGFIASIRDVTRRLEAVRALRESEEQFRTLAERSPNMIFINQAGRIVYANERCAEVMGYSREELASAEFDFRSLIAPESRPMIHDSFVRHMRGDDVPPYEYSLLTRDGRRVEAIITTRLVPFRGNQAILGIVTDITDRKRMEAELQKSDKLESLGVLAGGIAHDFNNTLAIIAGNASLGHRLVPAASELAQLLADIEHAALQGRQLTRQLLTFAKGGAPVKRTLSLAALVRETLDFALSGSKIVSRVALPAELWPVEVDEGQFVQVFNNLFLNAVQAMPDGGAITVAGENVTVDASEPSPLRSGRYVRITVRDEGVGIPQSQQRRIFDPFFTTKPGGTGLGLSTVYSIVKRHAGHVEVESEVGKGSTFVVWVPAGGTPAPCPEPPAAPAPRAGAGRILIMDDQPQVRGLVGRFLELAGFQVRLAESGEAAIESFRAAQERGEPFHVVIVDLTVPGGLGGKETLGQLRALDPDVRAVVSSGYSEDPVMADHRAFGFRGALTKPYELDEMVALLRRVLEE
ncbi:MAG: PAS domain S-box protein [Acidobacteria bacterium]|nr:PAS domain S-box protein [Acidobacteriota bacterium]